MKPPKFASKKWWKWCTNDEVANKELAALWSVNGWNLDNEGCRSNNWDLNFGLCEFYRWKSVLYAWTAQDCFCSVRLGRKNPAIWSRTWLRGRYICIHHCVCCEVLIRDKPFGPFLWRRHVWLVTGDGISKITPLQPTKTRLETFHWLEFNSGHYDQTSFCWWEISGDRILGYEIGIVWRIWHRLLVAFSNLGPMNRTRQANRLLSKVALSWGTAV